MGPGVTAIVEYVVVVGVAVDVRVPGGESVVRPGWARAEDRREAMSVFQIWICHVGYY